MMSYRLDLKVGFRLELNPPRDFGWGYSMCVKLPDAYRSRITNETTRQLTLDEEFAIDDAAKAKIRVNELRSKGLLR